MLDNRSRTLVDIYFESCQKNNIEEVQHCIALGVNINSVSSGGLWSGLAICAKNNYLQLLDILLSCDKIDVNIKTSGICISYFIQGNYTALGVA